MTFGPIDVLAVTAPGTHFDGSVLATVVDLVDRDIVRVIDMVIVSKEANGGIETTELRDLNSEVLAALTPLKAEITGLVSRNDIQAIADAMDNDSTAAILLYENVWAVRTKEALERVGARLLVSERIPAVVIEEELKDISLIASANG